MIVVTARMSPTIVLPSRACPDSSSAKMVIAFILPCSATEIRTAAITLTRLIVKVTRASALSSNAEETGRCQTAA